MEILTTIALVLFSLFIAGEVFAAIYIFRNRFAVRRQIRSFLGLDYLESNLNALTSNLNAGREEHGKILRRLNYVANHTKFERDQLRKMGILKDVTPATPQERQASPVIPLRIRN